MGAFRDQPLVLRWGEGAEVLRGQRVTSGFFQVLGATPALGRGFTASDDARGTEPVAILSTAFWERRFGADPDVLGQRLDIEGTSHTVVGVMAADFDAPPEPFPFPGLPEGRVAVWTTLPDNWLEGGTSVSVVGRLAPGVSVEAAGASLETVHAALVSEAAFPDLETTRARVQPLLGWMLGDVGQTLWFLMAAVGLILVVAMVNIANMLTASGLTRRREFAVRTALGAGRSGLLRLQLLEAAILSCLGGLAGVALAWLVRARIAGWLPPSIPRVDSIEINLPVLAAGIGLTAVTTLVVGGLPAALAGRVAPDDVLRSSGRGSTQGRRARRALTALVVVELSAAFVLLAAATLLGGSYARLSGVEHGFHTADLVNVPLARDPGRAGAHPGCAGRSHELRAAGGR